MTFYFSKKSKKKKSFLATSTYNDFNSCIAGKGVMDFPHLWCICIVVIVNQACGKSITSLPAMQEYYILGKIVKIM
jgi:hypothetical protein